MNILCQRDARWKDTTLGTKGTIGDYGCLITCLAMASGLTPIEVNDKLKGVGGYQDGNLVIWTKIQAAIPSLQFEFRGTTYNNDKVKSAIDKNGYCIVEVDGSRIGGARHWVLYIGNGQMYDPWTGVQKATSYYPATGYSIVNKVSIPEAPKDPTLVSCEADLAEQQKQVSNLQKQVDGLLVDIKAWETKYNECNTQRIEATSSSDGFRGQLNALVAQLATKLGTRQEIPEIMATIDTLITYEDANAELQKKLAKEESDHKVAVDTFEAKIKALESNLASLKADFKALKDTQNTSIQIPPSWSILNILKHLFGG